MIFKKSCYLVIVTYCYLVSQTPRKDNMLVTTLQIFVAKNQYF